MTPITNVTGVTLKELRQAQGLSLGQVGGAMFPPVTRQYLFRVERQAQVPATWVARYQGAFTSYALLQAQDSHRRLVVAMEGTSPVSGDYDPIGLVLGYDDAYRTATAWHRHNRSVVRVTLAVTGWPETQGVIDALSQAKVQVITVDPDDDRIIRRRV